MSQAQRNADRPSREKVVCCCAVCGGKKIRNKITALGHEDTSPGDGIVPDFRVSELLREMQDRPGGPSEFDDDDDALPSPVPPADTEDLPRTPFVEGSRFSGSDVDAWVAWYSATYNLEREAAKDLLFCLNALHDGNAQTSKSQYLLLKRMAVYGVNLQVYDCCRKDCMVFRGDDILLKKCKICDKDRFKDVKCTRPFKSFYYLPLIGQLKSALQDPEFCRLVQYCYERKEPDDPDSSEDVYDGSAWPAFLANLGFRLAPGLLCLVFALCLDGFNPFDKTKSNYSLWPAFIKILNFAPHLRNKPQFMFLVFMTQGPLSPKHLSPYLELLVEELLLFAAEGGVAMFHGLDQSVWAVRAGLLYLCGDYPGSAEVRCLRDHKAKSGCCCCRQRGFHVPGLKKVVWTGACRHLPVGHPLRVSAMKSPEVRTDAFIKEGCRELSLRARSSKATQKRIKDAYGITGISALTKLPYFDMVKMSVSDIMHWLENAGTQLLMLLSLRRAQNQPDELAEMAVALGLESVHQLPKAGSGSVSWAVAPADFPEVERRLKSVLRPPGFNLDPLKIWKHPGQVKAAGWIVFFKYLAIFVFDGLLQPQMQIAFNAYVTAVVAVLDHVQSKKGLKQLHVQVVAATVLLEGVLPVYAHTLMLVHQPVHIVLTLMFFGPCHASWMFGFERLMAWLKRLMKKKDTPEMSIIMNYKRTRMGVGAVRETWTTGKRLYRKDVALGDVEDGEGSYEFVPRVMRKGAATIGKGSRKAWKLRDEIHKLRVCYSSFDDVWAGIMHKWEAAALAQAAFNRANGLPHVLALSALPFMRWFADVTIAGGVLTPEEQKHIALFGSEYTNHASITCNGAAVRVHKGTWDSVVNGGVYCSFVKVFFNDRAPTPGWRFGKVVKILEHSLGEGCGQSDTGTNLILQVEWYPKSTVDVARPGSPYVLLKTSADDKANPYISAEHCFSVPVALSANKTMSYLLGKQHSAALES